MRYKSNEVLRCLFLSSSELRTGSLYVCFYCFFFRLFHSKTVHHFTITYSLVLRPSNFSLKSQLIYTHFPYKITVATQNSLYKIVTLSSIHQYLLQPFVIPFPSSSLVLSYTWTLQQTSNSLRG